MVHLRVRPLLASAAVALALAAARGAHAQRGSGTRDEDIVIIANADVPASSIAAREARRIFLLRQRFWHRGGAIAPVNLPASSELRRDFSVKLLGRTVKELTEYWNDLYFHGTEPPPVLESERAVLLYVARTPGAIGYVYSSTLRAAPERDAVKVLLTLEP